MSTESNPAQRYYPKDSIHQLFEEQAAPAPGRVALVDGNEGDGSREQRSIGDRCFHPSGAFVEFKNEDAEQSIPGRFEQQVAKYPDRIAVKTKNRELTYRNLNHAANRIARAVLAQRGKKEEPIVLLVENDFPMMAAILGILKAGKICVPLDLAYHGARATSILEDSHAKLIVTNTKNITKARELAPDACTVLNMDELDSRLSAEDLGLSISPDISAYILYTSGTTGDPKGVVYNHRNLLLETMEHTNALHICAEDRIILLASCSGGQGTNTTFSALLNGSTLYIWNLKEEGLADLASWFIREQITIYISAPTAFRNFVSTLSGKEKFPRLRLLKLASEPICKTDVELYKRHFSAECILVNWLSSTEAGNFAHYFLDKKTEIMGDVVPAGYPARYKEVLLLDEAGNKVGFNQLGEIAVKSRYLSLGYWRNPCLTHAAFLPDPAGGNEKIYRTGDLGLMRADGCLEYHGRKDFQLKIRGYRVELSEVEMALLNFASIKQAAVVAREERPGDQRLVAYIVPVQGQVLNTTELSRFLRWRLPDYMVPAAFMFLDSMPFAPNGKVDRRALPIPNRTRPELPMTFVAPQDGLEFQVTRIWQEVLGIEPVGVHDNFFDLGGHSLLAMSILAQIEKAFGKNLPLATLFQAPTVEQLASILCQDGRSAPPCLVIPFQPKGSKPPFFCHGASLEMARPLGTDQPFYGLQPHGQDGRQAPSTVEDMAADYINQIRTIQPEGPYFLGGYSFGGIVAFEMAQQLQKQGQQVALLVLIDPASPSGDLSPHSASSGVNTTSFRYEVYLHLHALGRLGTREKLSYVLERVRWRLEGIKRKMKMIVCKFYLGIGRRVPPSLRMFYFFEVSRHANLKYVPQIYPGRIIFLKAEKSSVEWRRLAAEGLEIHEVPGQHLELLRGPHAQVLGENLRSCLEQTS